MMVDSTSRSHNPWLHSHLESRHAMHCSQGVPPHPQPVHIYAPSSNPVTRSPPMHLAAGEREATYDRAAHPGLHSASSLAHPGAPISPAAFAPSQSPRVDGHTRNPVEVGASPLHNAAPGPGACAATPAAVPPAPFGENRGSAGGLMHYAEHQKSRAPPSGPLSALAPVLRQNNPDLNLYDRPTPALLDTSINQPSNMPPQAPGRVTISGILNDTDNDVPKQELQSGPSTPSSSSGVFPVPRMRYGIQIRQQPIAARSCGFGERDRRVIDPPPIVQVTIEDHTLSMAQLKEHLGSYSTMHCTIYNENGDEDCSRMIEDLRTARRLMGTVVSVPFFGKDEFGEDGCFFCFPDLSCRTPGVYRLKFRFIVLDPRSTMKVPIVASAMSDPITVYQAKDFPGMQRSTPLARRLKQQGCPISIKRGNDRSGPMRGGGSNDGSDDDSNDDNDDNQDIRKRKRQV